MEDEIYPEDMSGQHVVVVTEEISFGQWCSGAEHSQGQLFISYLICQRITKAINDRLKINLLNHVHYGATETGPRLCRRQVLL